MKENVFLHVPRGSFINKDREHFVSIPDYRRLLDACPDQEWRTLLALCRIGGLRNPSETLQMRWIDINWEQNKVLVRSPKTEHHEGKESRLIPLFPELREELEKQFEQAREGAVFVIDQWRDTERNLRQHFERIIFRAAADGGSCTGRYVRRRRAPVGRVKITNPHRKVAASVP